MLLPKEVTSNKRLSLSGQGTPCQACITRKSTCNSVRPRCGSCVLIAQSRGLDPSHSSDCNYDHFEPITSRPNKQEGEIMSIADQLFDQHAAEMKAKRVKKMQELETRLKIMEDKLRLKGFRTTSDAIPAVSYKPIVPPSAAEREEILRAIVPRRLPSPPPHHLPTPLEHLVPVRSDVMPQQITWNAQYFWAKADASPNGTHDSSGSSASRSETSSTKATSTSEDRDKRKKTNTTSSVPSKLPVLSIQSTPLSDSSKARARPRTMRQPSGSAAIESYLPYPGMPASSSNPVSSYYPLLAPDSAIPVRTTALGSSNQSRPSTSGSGGPEPWLSPVVQARQPTHPSQQYPTEQIYPYAAQSMDAAEQAGSSPSTTNSSNPHGEEALQNVITWLPTYSDRDNELRTTIQMTYDRARHPDAQTWLHVPPQVQVQEHDYDFGTGIVSAPTFSMDSHGGYAMAGYDLSRPAEGCGPYQDVNIYHQGVAGAAVAFSEGNEAAQFRLGAKRRRT